MRLRAAHVLAASTTLIASTAACGFDPSGYGQPTSASIGDGGEDDPDAEQSDDADSADGTTGGAGDGAGSAADDGGESDTRGGDTGGDAPASDGGADAGDDAADTGEGPVDATTGASDDGDSNGGEQQCPQPLFELHWAEAAAVDAPMQLVATDANDAPMAAVSVVAETGTITFDLEFPCAGEYAIWGLVWDYSPGALASSDPDSFYVGVGGPESTWRYGCQTGGLASGLSWQRLAALEAQPCDAAPVVLEVYEAGPVQLTFRNREAGSGNAVAGLSAIVVSSDAQADPGQLYVPY